MHAPHLPLPESAACPHQLPYCPHALIRGHTWDYITELRYTLALSDMLINITSIAIYSQATCVQVDVGQVDSPQRNGCKYIRAQHI